MKRICVFCGASPGAKTDYIQAAHRLGHALVRHGIGLVYGGGKVGIMGAIGQAVLEAGGEVIGIIPESLVRREVAYADLPDLRIVDTMHARKAMMAELADGFIALPGGLGTLEEFFEILTMAQLGMHDKPCGLLNTCGYFDRLIEFIGHTVDQQFVQAEHGAMVLVEQDPEVLLARFGTYQPPRADKTAWVRHLAESC